MEGRRSLVRGYRLDTSIYSHASWGMRIIGGILPGMVDYIARTTWTDDCERGGFPSWWVVKIESANTPNNTY